MLTVDRIGSHIASAAQVHIVDHQEDMMLAVDKRRGEAIGHIIDIGPREAPVMLLPVEDVVALEMEPDIDRAIHLDLCRDRNVWDGSNTAGCIDRIRLQCDLYSSDRANS